MQQKCLTYYLGEKEATISNVLPTLKLIEVLLGGDDDNVDGSLTQDIQGKIVAYLSNKIVDNDITYKKACFLDPRFKGEYPEAKELLMSEAQPHPAAGKHLIPD